MDIKERLRKHHGKDLRAAIEGGYDSDPIYTDALAEIERLEKMYAREREAHAANLKQQQRCEAQLASARQCLERITAGENFRTYVDEKISLADAETLRGMADACLNWLKKY